MIQPAIYTDNEIFENNPFIDALPPMLEERELIRSVARYPEHKEEFRARPKAMRVQLLNKQFRELYQPLPFIVDLYVQIYCALQSAYAMRGQAGAGMFRDTGASFSVVGISGMSKTTALRKILALFPQCIRHTCYHGRQLLTTQVTYLCVQTPHNASVKSLCLAIIDSIDEVTGSSFRSFIRGHMCTAENLALQITKIAKQINLGLLIIDEIQNVVFGKTSQLLNFLVQFSNTAEVSLCMVGTPQALGPLQETMRFARRSAGIRVDRLEYGKDFDLLLNAAWPIQYTQHKIPLTPQLRQYLFDSSSGITDTLLQILVCTQRNAILSGEEKLDIHAFHKTCAGELKVIHDSVQSGKRDKENGIASDSEFPAVPVKIEEEDTIIQNSFEVAL